MQNNKNSINQVAKIERKRKLLRLLSDKTEFRKFIHWTFKLDYLNGSSTLLTFVEKKQKKSYKYFGIKLIQKQKL